MYKLLDKFNSTEPNETIEKIFSLRRSKTMKEEYIFGLKINEITLLPRVHRNFFNSLDGFKLPYEIGNLTLILDLQPFTSNKNPKSKISDSGCGELEPAICESL